MEGIDQSREAAAHREYQLWRFLCSELLRWGNDDGFRFHMNSRKKEEMQKMWNRYYEIRGERSDFLAKRMMQTFLNDIIRFMRGRLPLRRDHGEEHEHLNRMLPLKSLRWEGLIKRAEKWRNVAQTHDWTQGSLRIRPQWADHEPWWNDARTIAFCNSDPFTVSNPFVVSARVEQEVEDMPHAQGPSFCLGF